MECVTYAALNHLGSLPATCMHVKTLYSLTWPDYPFPVLFMAVSSQIKIERLVWPHEIILLQSMPHPLL